MPLKQVAVTVQEKSQAGEARRAAAVLADRVRLSAEDAGRAAIVVTEAAGNLAKHAKDGQLVVRAVSEPWTGLEILALDKGPGIASLAECFRDGYSTSGTPGTGLGAIRRIADDFDIYTQPDRGTVLLARIYARDQKKQNALAMSAVSVPLKGEDACGDNWAIHEEGRKITIMIADGLGHGFIAAQAADEAVHIFSNSKGAPVRDLLLDMHAALRSTRGAAIGIAQLDLDLREVRYTAVGNIAGAVLTPQSVRMMVYSNGTVGAEMHKAPREFIYHFPLGATLLLHSDGLSTWHLEKYPGLLARDPAVIAGVLFRDFRRVRDDVTVVVARETHA